MPLGSWGLGDTQDVAEYEFFSLGLYWRLQGACKMPSEAESKLGLTAAVQ